MKKFPVRIALAIGLTLAFYLLAYYLLPGPPPSALDVALFAAIACALVWGVAALRRKPAPVAEVPKPSPGKPPVIPILCLVALTLALSGCTKQTPSGNQSSSSSAPAHPAPATTPAPTPAPAPASAPTAPPRGGGGSPAMESAALARITGTALLFPADQEQPGFGLYSYALLSHPPSEADLPRYRAYLRALVDRPTAAGLAVYVPKQRINITYIPLTAADPNWDADTPDAKVDFILQKYDFNRSAAMLGSLPTSGPGPILISVLQPLSLSVQPHPVLVEDLSLAQPQLMATYVGSFVAQVAKDQFWQESTLASFALGLRNSLETAALALNLSASAVDTWISYFK